MSELNLPPFYVGQKVVCIDNSDPGGSDFPVSDYFIKGKIYSVLALKEGCCSWEIDVGVRISNEPGWVKCLKCESVMWDDGDTSFWVLSRRFEPIQENFQSISLSQVIEKETELISSN